MCIFFNMNDTLGEILYSKITKIGQTSKDAKWKKDWKKWYISTLFLLLPLYSIEKEQENFSGEEHKLPVVVINNQSNLVILCVQEVVTHYI